MTPKLRMIATQQLREPARPARTTIDDAGLASLTRSIRDVGRVIEPLIVFPHDDGTYEVIAGHRRLLAGRAAGLAELPCIIEGDKAPRDAIKVHENTEREELSAADEAVFYAELYESNGQDVDRVCAIVKQGRDYVEGRLNLLRGDGAVFEALKTGQISLGVARELQAIERPADVAYYLEYAIRGGCSVRQARTWRGEANARAKIQTAAADGAVAEIPRPGEGAAAPPSGPSYGALAKPYELSTGTDQRPCLFCAEPSEEWRMYRKFVCAPCAETHLKPLELDARARAAGVPSGPSPS